MIRGKIDAAIPGRDAGLADGDIANWMIPGKMVRAWAGAMDLVHGAKKVIVLMEHVAKDGSQDRRVRPPPPHTGRGVVQRIITDLCVLDDLIPQGLGWSPGARPQASPDEDQVREKTERRCSEVVPVAVTTAVVPTRPGAISEDREERVRVDRDAAANATPATDSAIAPPRPSATDSAGRKPRSRRPSGGEHRHAGAQVAKPMPAPATTNDAMASECTGAVGATVDDRDGERPR